MNTREVGRIGENEATEYLVKKGYKILSRNFNCHFGEIDLIAFDGTFVVFVEVKVRNDNRFGLPRESVNWHKQQTIVRCARYWLFKNHKTGMPVRFDVVELLSGRINHIEDAFRP